VFAKSEQPTKSELAQLRRRYSSGSYQVRAASGETWPANSESHAYQIRAVIRKQPQFAGLKIWVEEV